MAKAGRLFCSLRPRYERGRKGSRVGAWEEGIIQQKSPLAWPQDHLTCGFYSWPHNVCVGGGDITFSPTVLPHIPWPHRDITVGKYKAGFHEAWAYLGSESMWDMPGNKRPSLRLGAGQGDLFQQPQIALCFLNWQTPATFDRNDMQLAGSPGLPGRPPFSRKIVLNLAHKESSMEVSQSASWTWWVQLAADYTCVGKVAYFRVWDQLSKVLIHTHWWTWWHLFHKRDLKNINIC